MNNNEPISSSEFRHIDRADSDPIAECFVCRKRLAFRAYYGMPICFVCEQNTSEVATWAERHDGLTAFTVAMHEFFRQSEADAS